MNTTSHWFRPTILTTASLLLAAALATAGDGGMQPLPIPESRQPYTGVRRQQIRYRNSALLDEAHSQIGREDYQAAVQTLTTIITNDAGNNRARMMLINAHTRLGNDAEALALLDELIGHYPDAPDLYLERAFIHIGREQWAPALSDLTRFSETAPDGHPRKDAGTQSLAELLFQLQDFETAAVVMRGLVARDDTYARRAFLAECAIQQAQWDVAAAELEAARPLAATDQEQAAVNLALGYAHYNRGQYHEAERALEAAARIIDSQPEILDLLRLRALAAYRQQRFMDAAAFYGEALAFAFDESLALSRLDALQQAHDLNAAIEAADTYRQREGIPESFRLNMLERLMNLYIVKGDHEQALATARTLYAETQRTDVLLTAAIAAEKAGRIEAAIALYREYLLHVYDANATLSLHYAILTRCNQLRSAQSPEQEVSDLLDVSIPYLVRVIIDTDTPEILQLGARYELAQVLRERDDMDSYFPLMETVISTMPEGRFLHEYAVQMYGKGHFELALPVFKEAYEKTEEPDTRFDIAMAIADIHLIIGTPEEALEWLTTAREHGPENRRWSMGMAQADYQLGNYDATISRLQPIAGDDDRANMLIGYAFNRRQPAMQGLALTHMNRVTAPEALPDEQQFGFYANRAYLHFDQNMDEAALADLDQALAIRDSDMIEQVRLRTMLRAELYREVLEHGDNLIRKREQMPAPATVAEQQDALDDRMFYGQVYEAMGIAAYRLDRYDEAIELLTNALEQDEHLLQSRYMRGLAYHRNEQPDEARDDLLLLSDQAEQFPDTFRGDLAFLLGDLEEYDTGSEWLAQSLERYPYDIDAWQELGYQSMKGHRNKEALEAFDRAIALYDEIIPYAVPEAEANRYAEIRMSMKQEFTKIDKNWSFQIYGQRTDLNIEEGILPSGVPADSTQGALQSQGGISIGYRPPKFGFRNEKTLDIFLRVLANFDPDTWEPNKDTYQGGLGLVYKPFIRHNANIGFERLFKIGDASEDNWLWRNTYAVEYGERPLRHERFWLYRRGYAEASYYLEPPRRWVFFGQGTIGVSTFLADRLILTFPEALILGRYQTNDKTGIGTYWYYGPGLNLRLLEGEGSRTRDRWAMTAYAHYVWGKFERFKATGPIKDEDFEGWIIGLNLTR